MRIRLKERAFIGGRLREAGEIVTLAKGHKGPSRAVHRTHDRIDYDPANGLDANRILGEIVDEPLFEELPLVESERSLQDIAQGDKAAQLHAEAKSKLTAWEKSPPRALTPAPVQPTAEPRVLTHVEERETW